jgi:hypothetical protein
VPLPDVLDPRVSICHRDHIVMRITVRRPSQNARVVVIRLDDSEAGNLAPINAKAWARGDHVKVAKRRAERAEP